MVIGGVLRDQRIEAAEGGEGGEVAVGGPEFLHAVVEAEGGDAGIVDFGASDFSREREFAQFLEVSWSFAEEAEGGARLPGGEGVQGGDEGRGWLVNFWMSHDGQELMKAGPRDGPRAFRIGESGEFLVRSFVPRRVLAVGVDQDVGVDRDHE